MCLPVGEKDWAAISYRLDDNFKTDGKWEMPLWHIGAIDEAVAHALDLLRPGGKPARKERHLLSLPAGNRLYQFLQRVSQQPAEDTGEDPLRITDPFCGSRIGPIPVGQNSHPLPFAFRRADRAACCRVRVCIHGIPPCWIKIRKNVQTSREDLTIFRNVRTPCIRLSAPSGANIFYHPQYPPSMETPLIILAP